MQILENKIIKFTISWLIIGFIAFLICLPFTNAGYIYGHDNVFHFSHIRDLYDGIKAGRGFSPITNLYHGIGYGTRLFYASFTHTLTVVIGLIIEPFGFGLLAAFKIVIFLSIFISGIMTYHFAKRITGNNFYGVIAAILYMAFPYRIVDIYIRNAASEIFSFVFLPGIFWGIYEILNQKNDSFFKSTLGYLLVIINFSLLILTHNISAVYCAIFAVLFILFNIHKVIKLVVNNPKNILYAFISCLLILGITSPLWTSLLAQQNSPLNYVVLNSQSMGSTLERIKAEIDRTSAFMLSGFNFYELNFLKLMFCCTCSLIIYLLIKGNLKFKYAKLIAVIAACFIQLIMPLIIDWNFPNYFDDSYKASIILTVVFIFFNLVEYKSVEVYRKKQLSLLLGLTGLFAVTFYLLYNYMPWTILPKFLYNIQFPWRLWSFFSLFIALIIPILMNYIKVGYHHKKIGLSVLAMFSLISIFPINKGELMRPYDEKDQLITPTDINNYPYNIWSGGWSREYFPEGFFNYSPTRSQLSESIRSFLLKEFNSASKTNDFVTDKDFIDITFHPYSTNNPNFICSNEINEVPHFSADFTISSDTTIQIPFLYYVGYEATIINVETNQKTTFVPYQSDYLVTIDLKAESETTYYFTLDYVGSATMQIADVISPICIILLVLIPLGALYIEIKSQRRISLLNSHKENSKQIIGSY